MAKRSAGGKHMEPGGQEIQKVHLHPKPPEVTQQQATQQVIEANEPTGTVNCVTQFITDFRRGTKGKEWRFDVNRIDWQRYVLGASNYAGKDYSAIAEFARNKSNPARYGIVRDLLAKLRGLPASEALHQIALSEVGDAELPWPVAVVMGGLGDPGRFRFPGEKP